MNRAYAEPEDYQKIVRLAISVVVTALLAIGAIAALVRHFLARA